MAAAADLDAVAAARTRWPGWATSLFDVFPSGRLYYYRDEDGPRACHLHVVPADTFGTPATSGCCATTCAPTRRTPAGTPS